jgi:hypothetical protein
VVLMVIVSVGLIWVREQLPGDSTVSPSPS